VPRAQGLGGGDFLALVDLDALQDIGHRHSPASFNVRHPANPRSHSTTTRSRPPQPAGRPGRARMKAGTRPPAARVLFAPLAASPDHGSEVLPPHHGCPPKAFALSPGLL